MKYWSIEIDDLKINEINLFLEKYYFSNVSNSAKTQNHSYSRYAGFDNCPPFEKEKLKILITDLYADFGYKSIVAILKNKNVTYTKLRTIFRKLEIKGRTGRNVETKFLSKIRQQKALKEKTWKDWPHKYPEMNINNKRHIQGYYRKNDGKQVWLRSSWEYGYACYLDSKNIKWDVECKTFVLSSGKNYRPDFFIFDSEANLVEIVEIKADYNLISSRGVQKFKLLKEASSVPCKLIQSDLFQIIEKSPSKVLREWKKTRTMEKE